MNEIQLQEKHIYHTLSPLFSAQGYELLTAKNQFRLPTRNGYRAALITVNGNRYEQTIDLHLSIRLDVVEELVNQFISEIASGYNESATIIASYGRLTQQPYKRFLVKNEAGLEAACKHIDTFMRNRGFGFLEKFDRLRKIDPVINRKPEQPCPLLHDQIIRCFKGIAIAKLTHRNDFNRLVKTYQNYLNKQWTHPGVVANFKKLVKYLRFFSID